MRFIGVFNHDGGTFRLTDMEAFMALARDIFAEAGHVLETRSVGGRELIRELDRAVRDAGGDVVLAGGGDGTISAAAAACFRAGKPLAVLPAGTMNLFARTLRVPMNPEQALREIAAGKLFAVDIATANGQPFVHQYSVGVHARLVRVREELEYNNRWQKKLASVQAITGTLAKPLRFKVDILTPHGPEQRLASGISVSNNVLAEGHVPYADDVDGGVLGVYLVKPMSRWDMLKLLLGVALGRWKGHPRVSEKAVTSVTLVFPRRKRSAKAVIDGELVPLPSRVELRIHPGALRVFAPLALEAAVAPNEAGPAPAEERGPDAVA